MDRKSNSECPETWITHSCLSATRSRSRPGFGSIMVGYIRTSCGRLQGCYNQILPIWEIHHIVGWSETTTCSSSIPPIKKDASDRCFKWVFHSSGGHSKGWKRWIFGTTRRFGAWIKEQNHRILLQPDSKRVKVRSHRYPHRQKERIETMVQEMLE